MIIYSSTVEKFKDDMFNGILIQDLDKQVRKFYRGASSNEFISWRNSLQYMNIVLNRANLPENSGVAIEYMIPATSKRIDFIISGYNEDNRPIAVVIELKQWSEAECTDKDNIIKTFVGGTKRELPHPSYQAWSYCKLLEDFNESVEQKEIALYPCAYLHNYLPTEEDSLCNSFYDDILAAAPLFNQLEASKLVEFLSRYVKKGDDKTVLYEIENGRIRPAKALQNALAEMLSGNDVFTMIDDQKVVFENIIAMLERSKRDHKKRVYIVEGGPGTGKSVVAINALVEALRRGHVAHYITNNSAPRNVYCELLKGKHGSPSVNHLFKGSGSYTSSPANDIDLAIVDEAHRLRVKGNYARSGSHQIDDIINASLCSVFFIDEDQIVTAHDVGEVKEIKRWSKRYKAKVESGTLQSQFRCNGSDGYLAWLDDILFIRETANKFFDLDYDFDVVDSPQELEKWVKSKMRIGKSRIVAGYCWEWPSRHRNDPSFKDISIHEHDYDIAWNLKQGLWALRSDASEEVGCIHTTQGLEFDYVGVIIGPDMYYENGVVKTNFEKRAKSDRSLNGLKSLARQGDPLALHRIDRIIKNTYRTLMTRGMKGCRIFCVDRGLAQYFRRRLVSEYSIQQIEDEFLYVADAEVGNI